MITAAFTRRNNLILFAAAAILGTVAVLFVDSADTANRVLLFITAVQGWAFTVFYGLASTWRTTAASRALFWIVLTYSLLATHVLASVLWSVKVEWFSGVRPFLWLGLALAGFNLLLTAIRLVLEGRDAR